MDYVNMYFVVCIVNMCYVKWIMKHVLRNLDCVLCQLVIITFSYYLNDYVL